MKFRIVSLLVVGLLISGCSLLLNRTTQEIYVTTPNTTNAYCVLETKKQRYQVLTPNRIHIERSAYDITVTCNKVGYKTAYKTIKSTAVAKPAWMGLNHYTPGIDTNTLTSTVYSYPETISLLLSPKTKM